MDENTDVLAILKARIKYHEHEIMKLQNAIAAYKGTTDEPGNAIPRRTIKWTQEVENVLSHGEELTFEEIKQRLIDKGIDQVTTTRGRSSLSVTLRRMSGKKGKLSKTENGKYQKKPRLIRRRFPLEENSDEIKQTSS